MASVEKANNQNDGNLNVIGSDEDFESSEDEPMENNTDPNYQPNRHVPSYMCRITKIIVSHGKLYKNYSKFI